jgi:hypothetical protein
MHACGDKHVAGARGADTCLRARAGYSALTANAWLPMSGSGSTRRQRRAAAVHASHRAGVIWRGASCSHVGCSGVTGRARRRSGPRHRAARVEPPACGVLRVDGAVRQVLARKHAHVAMAGDRNWAAVLPMYGTDAATVIYQVGCLLDTVVSAFEAFAQQFPRSQHASTPEEHNGYWNR